jgi:acylphosphatase
MRYDVIFRGRVQGVGFRATARHIAARHPRVAGWVRNEADGSVRLVAEGEPTDLDAYLSDLRKFMAPFITGENVSRADTPQTPAMTGFEIRG